MIEPLDPRLSSIERHLERLSTIPASPSLRRRILTSLQKKKKVPATKYGVDGRAYFPFLPDLVAGTFLAVAVLLFVTVSIVGSMALVPRLEPVTLAERLRRAGLDDDPLLMAAVDVRPLTATPRAEPRGERDPPDRRPMRPIDARRLLKELL